MILLVGVAGTWHGHRMIIVSCVDIWVLTVKGNQPRLRRQLAELPWSEVTEGHRGVETGHGRRE